MSYGIGKWASYQTAFDSCERNLIFHQMGAAGFRHTQAHLAYPKTLTWSTKLKGVCTWSLVKADAYAHAWDGCKY